MIRMQWNEIALYQSGKDAHVLVRFLSDTESDNPLWNYACNIWIPERRGR